MTHQTCFVCNTRASFALRNAVTFFGEIYLPSQRQLSEVISDIVEKPILAENVHSKILCKKCYKTCLAYDQIHTRLNTLKKELLDNFKATLLKHDLQYETYNSTKSLKSPPVKHNNTAISSSNIAKKNITKTVLSPMKKIVLPASKLQPLPSDFALKVGTLPQKSSSKLISNVKSAKSQTSGVRIDQPHTEKGQEALTLPVKLLFDEMDQLVDERPSVTLDTSNSLLSFNVNSLPKDFLANNSEDSDKDGDDNTNSDLRMAIDEEYNCSLIQVMSKNNKTDFYKVYIRENEAEDSIQQNSSTNELVSENDEGAVIEKKDTDKINLTSENVNTDQEEIIMRAEDGAIVQVLKQPEFDFNNKRIQLIVSDVNDDDDNDDQDSNDGQIELQVSGDEETANAIIEAAKQQGGAFIKVGSGEMYRVKSIHSKTTEDDAQLDHMAAIVEKEGDKYKCVLCEKNNAEERFVGDAESVSVHMRHQHDARVYICALCSRIFRKRHLHTQHMNEHEDSDTKKGQSSYKSALHECKLCNKKLPSRSLLTEHMNQHSGTRPLACPVCGKTFASKYTHLAHLKTHVDRPRPFKCRECNKSFFTHQNRINHERTHSGIKDFICKICNKAFGTQHNLEVHGVVHTRNKRFRCDQCDKCFARRAELTDHLRTHTGERPFSCGTCGAAFSQRANLQSHARATHLHERRHACPRCDKRFKRRRLLEYHVKAAHTGERPLRCDSCDATFVYPEHYKKHCRIHSGEKPYSCEICGKSFNSADNRNTHRFIHSDKKPFECLVCGAGFMRKQLVYQHMNTAGHLAESIVVNQPRIAKESSSPQSTTTENAENKTDSVEIDTIKETEGLVAIENYDTTIKIESNVLESFTAEQLGQAEIVANDENGDIVRLIPVQLPDGNNGWVAVSTA